MIKWKNMVVNYDFLCLRWMQSCTSRRLSMRKDLSFHQAAPSPLCPAPRQGDLLRTNASSGTKPRSMIFGGGSKCYFIAFPSPNINFFYRKLYNKRVFNFPFLKNLCYRGSPNIEMDEQTFMVNRERAVDYLNSLDKVLNYYFIL